MISYKPFFETLEKRNISQYQLFKEYCISPNTMTRIRQNKSITLNTIDALCSVLNCEISDIVCFVK